MSKSAVERKAAERERRKAAGLIRVEVWVRPEHKAKLQELAKKLEAGEWIMKTQWKTTSYTVRRPGNTAWENGIKTFGEARKEAERANNVAPGHVVYAEQEYVGSNPGLVGKTRTVER